jgi:hypothetical protein
MKVYIITVIIGAILGAAGYVIHVRIVDQSIQEEAAQKAGEDFFTFTKEQDRGRKSLKVK